MAAKRGAKRKSKQVILPRKMSKLIEIGLRDLKKSENTRGVFIDMSDWYVGNAKLICEVSSQIVKQEPACTVCFAGAVMANTLKCAGQKSKINPYSKKMHKNEDQLLALNDLRRGWVGEAAHRLGLLRGEDRMGISTPEYNELTEKLNANIPEYNRDNPAPFHRAMEKLRLKLVKAGY